MSIMQGLQDLLDPEEKEDRELKEQRRKSYRDSLRGPSVNSDTSGVQALANQMSSQHFGVQNNAIATVNDAISKELQSRVNQQREMRRMAHAQEMMRLQAEAARRERDGDIIRSLLNG